MNDIQVRGLAKHFGSTLAVNHLTFDVCPGTVTGFLGPNGAGKSTTMRMILGLDRPDQGSALVNRKAYRELRWPLREVGAMLSPRDFAPIVRSWAAGGLAGAAQVRAGVTVASASAMLVGECAARAGHFIAA
jgi:ABC-2 type transport system ATP-binding protein